MLFVFNNTKMNILPLKKAKNSTSWLALFFLSWNNFSDLQWLDSVKDIWLLRSSQDSYEDLQM